MKYFKLRIILYVRMKVACTNRFKLNTTKVVPRTFSPSSFKKIHLQKLVKDLDEQQLARKRINFNEIEVRREDKEGNPITRDIRYAKTGEWVTLLREKNTCAVGMTDAIRTMWYSYFYSN